MKFRKSAGFTFVELLIMGAIILVIIAIIVPHLLDAYIAQNEGNAIKSLRGINKTELGYRNKNPNGGYSVDLEQLKMFAGHDAGLNGFVGNRKSGYVFAIYGDDVATIGAMRANYYVFANPIRPIIAKRSFCMKEDGVVRESPKTIGVTADCTDNLDPVN